MRRLTAFILLVSSLACYSWQPVGAATPAIGQDVSLQLTPQGTVELARYLGPSVYKVDGRLTGTGSDGELSVAVDYVTMVNGTKQPWSGEGAVIFPRVYVETMRERKFEKRRTILGSGALAAALVGLTIVAIQGGGGTPGNGGGGTPPPP
jgi:hypothetical protein